MRERFRLLQEADKRGLKKQIVPSAEHRRYLKQYFEGTGKPRNFTYQTMKLDSTWPDDATETWSWRVERFLDTATANARYPVDYGERRAHIEKEFLIALERLDHRLRYTDGGWDNCLALLPVPATVLDSLFNYGIRTLFDISPSTEKELTVIPGVGKKTAQKLIGHVRAYPPQVAA